MGEEVQVVRSWFQKRDVKQVVEQMKVEDAEDVVEEIRLKIAEKIENNIIPEGWFRKVIPPSIEDDSEEVKLQEIILNTDPDVEEALHGVVVVENLVKAVAPDKRNLDPWFTGVVQVRTEVIEKKDESTKVITPKEKEDREKKAFDAVRAK